MFEENCKNCKTSKKGYKIYIYELQFRRLIIEWVKEAQRARAKGLQS